MHVGLVVSLLKKDQQSSFVGSFSLVWDGITTNTAPTFQAFLDSPIPLDTLKLEFYSNALLTTLVTSASKVLQSSDLTGTSVNVPVGTRADGTYYVVGKLIRGGKTIAISGTVVVSIAAAAPTLTLPVSSSVTSSGATIGVTTNTANGTLYYVVTYSAVPPLNTQVELGKDENGDFATKSGNQAIASTGAKTASVSGLDQENTDHYYYWMHKSAGGARSSVVGGTFTTLDIVPVLSAGSPSAAATGQTTATATISTTKSVGTIYGVVTTSATPPSATQIKNGLNNGGTLAAWNTSDVAPEFGTNTYSITGLSAGTTYYPYFVHENSAGFSNVVSLTSFTTTGSASSADVLFTAMTG